jgi:hypothetical protein
VGEVLEGLDRREQVWWAMQSGSTSSGCSSSSRRGCTAVGAALLQQVLCLPSLTIAHACKTIDTAASQRPGSVDALAFVAPASDYIVNYTYRHTHTPGYSRSRMVYGSSSSSRSSMGGAPVGGSSSNSSSSSTHARGAHESTHGENKGSLNGSDSGRVNRTVEARAESTGRGSSGSGTGQASSAMRAVAANGRNEGGSGRDSAKKAGPAELWLQNLQASYAEPPSLATTPLSTPPPPGDCKPSDQKRSQQLKQQGSLECVPSGWQSRPCDQHAGTSSHQGRGKEEHSQQLGGCKGDLQEGGGGTQHSAVASTAPASSGASQNLGSTASSTGTAMVHHDQLPSQISLPHPSSIQQQQQQQQQQSLQLRRAPGVTLPALRVDSGERDVPFFNK